MDGSTGIYLALVVLGGVVYSVKGCLDSGEAWQWRKAAKSLIAVVVGAFVAFGRMPVLGALTWQSMIAAFLYGVGVPWAGDGARDVGRLLLPRVTRWLSPKA